VARRELAVVCRSGHLTALVQHQQTPFELSKVTYGIRRKYVPCLCYVNFNYNTALFSFTRFFRLSL